MSTLYDIWEKFQARGLHNICTVHQPYLVRKHRGVGGMSHNFDWKIKVILSNQTVKKCRKPWWKNKGGEQEMTMMVS